MKPESDLCRKCGQRVVLDWMEEHLRVCGTVADDDSSAGEAADDAAPRLDRERLDATRDYPWNYRETGKLGSHPSHDPFDDDSNP